MKLKEKNSKNFFNLKRNNFPKLIKKKYYKLSKMLGIKIETNKSTNTSIYLHENANIFSKQGIKLDF